MDDKEYSEAMDKEIDLDVKPVDKSKPSFEDLENEYVKFAREFLFEYYKKELDALIFENKHSVAVDFKLIESFDPKFADSFLENPDFVLEAFKIILREYRNSYKKDNLTFEPLIRVHSLPDDKIVKIKYLSADNINKLICVEGIVKQFTTVLPKIKIAHWICKKCAHQMKTVQDDVDVVKPRSCPECKHKDFELDEKESMFIDFQKLEIQEPLDEVSGGDNASTLNIYVNSDLVNSFTAGDRILFTGVLRLKKPDKNNTLYGRYLDCLHVENTKQEYENVEITSEDEQKIIELSKRDDVYELISHSIASHINGHEKVKESISLQLFGGVRKVLKDKSRIRGNIHILLVGDPGTGKTQLVSYASRVAPKSLYVSGRGASGAGLTATAVKDEFSEGGWTLKAGAMVLASGGFAMIDEFDKMTTEDKSALHEALEQETVSIAKAGLVSTFKTETSVLAAANPKYGRFDNYKNIAEQIDFPPALMSRFDLFFVLRDMLDEKKDRETVRTILRTHREGEKIRTDESYSEEQKESYKANDLNSEFLKKYISYARTKIFPVMTEEAMQSLEKFYIDLRKTSKDGRVAVTLRQLEALIRLSEASARVRLSKEVVDADAKRAISLFKASMEQVGVDPETGQMDIDIITTGQSHSQTNKIKRILEIVDHLTKDKKTASFNEIVEEAEKEQIDSKKVRELIDKLHKSGDIYEPRPFNYSITKKD